MNSLPYGQPVELLVKGAGHAGWRAAEAARAANPGIRILVAGAELHAPYERPPLSKDCLLDPTAPAGVLATLEGCAQQGIELKLSATAVRLDRAERRVAFADGYSLRYDRLILATGSRPRRLPATVDPHGVAMVLRTREDSQAIGARLPGASRIVVLGAGFIGLEVAAMARRLGVEVVVIERDQRVAGRALPPASARRLEEMHRAKGVVFMFDTQVHSVAPGPAGTAVLETSRGPLEADMVLAGIGVVPNTELAAEAGLAVDDGVVVDATGQTSDPGIWAAGEVARHPVRGDSRLLRLESWQVAEQQARAAGASAAGARSEHLAWPWFWSDQYELNLQCIGHTADATQVIMRSGDRGAETHFFLGATQRLRGVVAFNAARDIAAARRLMDKGLSMDAAALADPGKGWQQWAAA